ncbi:hypothetical protein U1Q18_042232, partial [Sarracenia purpurea var. burkii]
CREDGLVDPDGEHRSLGIVDGGDFTRGRRAAAAIDKIGVLTAPLLLASPEDGRR